MKKFRILYMCSYIPYEFLEALGFECISIFELDSKDLLQTKTLKSICSLAEYCSMVNFHNFDGIILGNCCNSVQRLHDFVGVHYPGMFSFLLQIPKNTHKHSMSSLSSQYVTMIMKLNRHFNLPKDILRKFKLELIKEDLVLDNTIWIAGSCISQSYLSKLREIFHMFPILTTVCSSGQRGDHLMLSKNIENETWNISCPARLDYFDWFEFKLSAYKEKLSGVIFISMQKCDHGMFSYTGVKQLCDKYNIPVLYMIAEMSAVVSERSKIRYEAFIESIILKKNKTMEGKITFGKKPWDK